MKVNFGEYFGNLVDNCNLGISELSEGLNISKAQLYRFRERSSIDFATLENICRFFKINPSIFFDDELTDLPTDGIPHLPGRSLRNEIDFGQDEKIRMLEELVKEKERFIQHLLSASEPKENKD